RGVGGELDAGRAAHDLRLTDLGRGAFPLRRSEQHGPLVHDDGRLRVLAGVRVVGRLSRVAHEDTLGVSQRPFGPASPGLSPPDAHDATRMFTYGRVYRARLSASAGSSP